MSEGFLSRWSRRKQALARGEEPAEPPPPPEAPAEPPPAALPARTAAPAPTPEPEPEPDLASLPDIETLDATTDIRAFLRKGVPEALRNAALRKVYATDPVISSYMGPLDYAWDFNTPGGLPHGFAAELGEVGERLRQLIAQAVGEPPPLATPAAPEGVEGPPTAPETVLADAAPPPTPSLAPPLSDPAPTLPASALRLEGEPVALATPPAEALPPGPPPNEAREEPAASPPRRRHGGALPV